jgi:diguanylate cyclase (GGDEF)-like protein
MAELEKQDAIEKKNLLEIEIRKESEVIDSLMQKIVNYSQLKGLTEKMTLCLSTEDTSKTLSREVSRLFGHAEITAILYLFHARTGELGISSSQKGQMNVDLMAKKGDVFDAWVVKTLQPLLVENAKSDFRFDIDKVTTEEVRPVHSLISVPLLIAHKAIGILRVDSLRENHFRMEDLRFLTTIGDLGAVALDNAQLYEHLQELAIKDSLTGLYLRRYLMDRFPEEMARQLRNKKELSFLMIDLDEFKKYNDRFGHSAGDIVLKMVGAFLADTFKEPGNLVCRYGGEEFCVLLPECPKQKAVQLAESFRKKVEWQSIDLRRQQTHITVSIGVAAFPKDAQLKEELIAKADSALYRAKNAGRNQVCVA